MPQHTFTKILSSIGPSSEDPKVLEKLFMAGVDVCRMNFSHDSHENHEKRYNNIRALSKKLKRPIGILGDLQGAKHRIGQFVGEKAKIKPGQKFTFYLNKVEGNSTQVTLPHKEVYASVKKGTKILIDDGRIGMEVLNVSKDMVETKVIYGEEIKDNKGFNIPDVILDMPLLTEKDKKDLKFALKLGVDFVAVSFVQTVKDILEAKKLIGGKAKIIAKIEKPSACEDFEAIARECDAIMIARGDLAIEIGHAKVPVMQRMMIETCRRLGVPVITATDVFDSMTKKPLPTRAEVNDCATAVYLGTDAIMTSGETAAGNYPVETIKMMADVMDTVENAHNYRSQLEPRHTDFVEFTTPETLALSATDTADLVQAKAIIVFTRSGNMARRVSAYRPEVPVLAITKDEQVANQLCLSYGVKSVHIGVQFKTVKDMEKEVLQQAKAFGLKRGDKIVMIAGKKPGATDTAVYEEGGANFMTVVTL
ncbi:MAG: pyruvate kinase [Alphaproteobacteria bacterium]|nr:pyruvate kinase [Alphaproteobacteria bacterium]MBN2779683.1 pyruvate kinase [Alphaproteobacteria bacterium]